MATIFRLNPAPTFPATASIPDAGGPDIELDIEFKRKKKDELVAFFASLGDRSDADVLMEIVSGWTNCDKPFSREALEELLQNYPAAAKAILSKYANESTGARLGN